MISSWKVLGRRRFILTQTMQKTSTTSKQTVLKTMCPFSAGPRVMPNRPSPKSIRTGLDATGTRHSLVGRIPMAVPRPSRFTARGATWLALTGTPGHANCTHLTMTARETQILSSTRARQVASFLNTKATRACKTSTPTTFGIAVPPGRTIVGTTPGRGLAEENFHRLHRFLLLRLLCQAHRRPSLRQNPPRHLSHHRPAHLQFLHLRAPPPRLPSRHRRARHLPRCRPSNLRWLRPSDLSQSTT